jgi:uncharacterized cupin superfamily protein
VPEAQLEDSGSGLTPVSDGWCVVNVRDSLWLTSETRGSAGVFHGRDYSFLQFGINLRVLQPGRPNALYHSESEQEAFLVLFGECRLLVEGKERLLGPWDFFHCPAGTEHVLVGAGDGPCAIVAVGARSEDHQIRYPVSELAANYGASVAEETSDPEQAYAGLEEPRLERPSYWNRLPWA